ncbi:GntR family transcriptional regulator [Salipiger aestuarii]|uniref:DNA-binding GntR family transcriptional regulator n=1 Tax=Salipiger aestuarii TaxID=568098 RepID=A0A327YIC9_9RHOB|nr:GntR family transcriptional regulator [Salipiger aestuarii]KAA8611213.1 GntR family transcriptional regulator [Salipiger aestuarii]KAB2541966.1 GntR family transcriptional regulator [Salipiger aestuarii]RAK18109.1 DNA-binding GntR family transcriptional regulator [Salipiger aestuarii]
MDVDTDAGELGPLDREGLVQRVARRLSKAIVSGQLPAGQRLSESVIARRLGTSRAPVREAARLLENSGLVTYQPNRGFFVRSFTPTELDNLYEFRIVIELAAVRRLIREGDRQTVPALCAQIDVLHRVAEPGHDMLTQVEADMQFHRLICNGAGNPRFLATFEQIALETELTIMLIGKLYDDAHRLADTHVPIVEAIQAGDAPAASDAMFHHLDVARSLVTEQFRKLEGEKPL